MRLLEPFVDDDIPRQPYDNDSHRTAQQCVADVVGKVADNQHRYSCYNEKESDVFQQISHRFLVFGVGKNLP